VGVEKDVDMAQKLQAIAMETNPETEPLEKVASEAAGSWLLGLSVAAVAVAAIFTFMRVFRKK
jgi:hypothetical protein